jgi:hypothetical protein
MPEARYETKPLRGLTAAYQIATGLFASRACTLFRYAEGQSIPRMHVSNLRLQSIASLAKMAPPWSRFDRRTLGRAVVLSLLTWAFGVSACSAPSAPNAPLFGTGVFHPPPKPGDSISHTQMCECKVCDPANCCDGPDDDAPPAACSGDSYDFTSNPACGGLAVKSCTSRCTREIWRVRAGTPCDEKRPQTCCRAG